MATEQKMTPERFFDLFLEELKERPDMYHYYKFHEDASKFEFRKAYFLERLRYVAKYVQDGNKKIWDCGCGYGTTCLYLAMNGISSYGTTLEFYTEFLEKRYDFWNQYGDARLFTCSYENLFDEAPAPERYDQIIIQDTLHHLEPIHEALQVFHKSLKKNGQLIIIEENGNNVLQRIKLYKQRGNKRIIEIWDEKLQKKILLGNENIRSLKTWTNLFAQNNFQIDKNSLEYVRYYLPGQYNKKSPEAILKKEKELQKRSWLKREYLFFGINFVVEKQA